MKIQCIENHRLSDGGLAQVSRTGNTYNFSRSHNSLTEAPACSFNLTKEQAMKKLADTIQSDLSY